MRVVLLSSVFAALVVSAPSSAQDGVTACLLSGPSYQLASDTVVWQMSVGSGHSCIRGLRSWLAVIDSTKLITPPQTGQVKLEGAGFLYKASAEFQGEDSFVVLVSGKLNKINGSSTIRIVVLVR
jgi:hypothetical protein